MCQSKVVMSAFGKVQVSALKKFGVQETTDSDAFKAAVLAKTQSC